MVPTQQSKSSRNHVRTCRCWSHQSDWYPLRPRVLSFSWLRPRAAPRPARTCSVNSRFLVSFPLRFLSQSISELPVPSTMMLLMTSLLLSQSLPLVRKGRTQTFSAFHFCFHVLFKMLLRGLTVALSLCKQDTAPNTQLFPMAPSQPHKLKTHPVKQIMCPLQRIVHHSRASCLIRIRPCLNTMFHTLPPNPRTAGLFGTKTAHTLRACRGLPCNHSIHHTFLDSNSWQMSTSRLSASANLGLGTSNKCCCGVAYHWTHNVSVHHSISQCTVVCFAHHMFSAQEAGGPNTCDNTSDTCARLDSRRRPRSISFSAFRAATNSASAGSPTSSILEMILPSSFSLCCFLCLFGLSVWLPVSASSLCRGLLPRWFSTTFIGESEDWVGADSGSHAPRLIPGIIHQHTTRLPSAVQCHVNPDLYNWMIGSIRLQVGKTFQKVTVTFPTELPRRHKSDFRHCWERSSLKSVPWDLEVFSCACRTSVCPRSSPTHVTDAEPRTEQLVHEELHAISKRGTPAPWKSRRSASTPGRITGCRLYSAYHRFGPTSYHDREYAILQDSDDVFAAQSPTPAMCSEAPYNTYFLNFPHAQGVQELDLLAQFDSWVQLFYSSITPLGVVSRWGCDAGWPNEKIRGSCSANSFIGLRGIPTTIIR